jgi:hypothetical protein
LSINVHANEATDGIIKPEKIEYITSKHGKKIPVIYIDDPEKAQKFLEQNGFTRNQESAKRTEKTIEALATYQYVRYAGTLNYDYKVVYTQNTSNKVLPWIRKVTRSSSTKTSISVNSDFAKVFKASVGKEWNKTETFEDTFQIEIPPNKQAEIWTWNVAENYIFKNGTTEFNAFWPTDNFGQNIIITNFRDPVNG